MQQSLCRWSLAQSFEETAELSLWQRVNLTNRERVWCIDVFVTCYCDNKRDMTWLLVLDCVIKSNSSHNTYHTSQFLSWPPTTTHKTLIAIISCWPTHPNPCQRVESPHNYEEREWYAKLLSFCLVFIYCSCSPQLQLLKSFLWPFRLHYSTSHMTLNI